MSKLSIIIPVYNVEEYIERCLESIMSQDYKGYTVECLLIDDCTPDGSMIIAQRMIDHYKGEILFNTIKHQKNKGLSEARNTGIKNATGDYVLFVDSDDYLMPNSIDYMMQAKAQNPDIDIIIGNVYEHKYNKTQYHLEEPEIILGGSSVRRWMLTNEFAVSAWNKIFNRLFLIKNDLYFEPEILHEDIPWTYILYSKISSILLLPNVTYSYWYNPNSISSTYKPTDKTIMSYVCGCQLMLNTPYEEDLYVLEQLYIFRSLLNASNARNKNSAKDVIDCFHSTRSRLIKTNLHNRRFFLLSFFILLYRPFNLVFKIRLFRRHYNNISKTVGYVANKFNFLHRNNHK